MLEIKDLKPTKDSRKKLRRVGRGNGSGWGTQAGRGHKGQQARAGGGLPYSGFEGGQNPLYKRIPKLRGFKYFPKIKYSIANIDLFEKLKEGSIVNVQSLVDAGLLNKKAQYLKILGNGEITKPYTVQTHKISTAAKGKIEKAGGKVEILNIAKDNSTQVDDKKG